MKLTHKDGVGLCWLIERTEYYYCPVNKDVRNEQNLVKTDGLNFINLEDRELHELYNLADKENTLVDRHQYILKQIKNLIDEKESLDASIK